MTRLFDSYLMVDWSGAAVPVRGRDSIWSCRLDADGRHLENHPTRAAATEAIRTMLLDAVSRGRRVLAGFDFPLGYPRGFAAAVAGIGAGWSEVWQTLAARVEDGPDNRNNRLDVAERLNLALSGGAFPFWGCPRGVTRTLLLARGRRPHGSGDMPERRLIERRVPRTQPVFKLYGNGAVGSQALLGIPRLWSLRCHPGLAGVTRVWPFETGLAAPADDVRVVLAEIYPSLLQPDSLPGLPKDAGQVSATVHHLAACDAGGTLAAGFAADPGLDDAERALVEREEGWILGVTGLRRYVSVGAAA